MFILGAILATPKPFVLMLAVGVALILAAMIFGGGERRPQNRSAPNACKACGRVNPDNARYCAGCGRDLRSR